MMHESQVEDCHLVLWVHKKPDFHSQTAQFCPSNIPGT